MSRGYLTLYMGPMGASKTTKAVEECVRVSVLGKTVLYVNNSIDKRVLEGGVEGVFTSHNSSLRYLSDKVDTVSCSALGDIDFSKYDVVVIDEGQFFRDLVQTVSKLIQQRKTVSIYALSATSEMEKFGSVCDLIPMADRFKQLRAKCVTCSKSGCMVPAPFTHCKKDTVVQVGGMNMYTPMCGSCWNNASQ